MTDSIWTQGSSLGINEGWTSGNGRAILRLQEDGNLVLYKNSKAVWQAPHAVNLGDHARMQDDGNFVLYDRHKETVWASNTSAYPGAYLAIQDDGNVVIYDKHRQPRWTTNTAG
jgi:hypothetical protein